MPEMTKLDPVEESRTYVFPNRETVVLEGVVEFANSETTHRLRTRDGLLHIIPKTFLYIAIKASEFTL